MMDQIEANLGTTIAIGALYTTLWLSREDAVRKPKAPGAGPASAFRAARPLASFTRLANTVSREFRRHPSLSLRSESAPVSSRGSPRSRPTASIKFVTLP